MAKNLNPEIISLLANHTNPQKDEQLKKNKTEIDEKAAKLIEFIKIRNKRKKTGVNVPLSDIINLVEDFHKQYLSLYALHGNLIEDLKDKVRIRDEYDEVEEEESFTTYNAEDSFFSADEMSISSSPAHDHYRRVSDDFNNKLELIDLRNKLASMTEKEALNQDNNASLRKLQESEKVIEGLKTEAAVSLSKVQKSEKIIEGLNIEAKEKEKLFDELKGKYADSEKKLVSLKEQFETHVSNATAREKKLETEISSLKLEGENLSSEKRDLQEKLEAKVNEAKQFGEDKLKLLNGFKELEKASKEKEEQLSALKNKLDESKSDSNLKIEKVNHDFHKQTVNLKEILEKKKMDLLKVEEEKKKFEGQVKELEQKVDSIVNEKKQVEIQMEMKNKEGEQLRVDNEDLHERITQLRKLETKRSGELSAVQTVLAGLENDSSVKIKMSEEEVKKLQEKMKLNVKIIERKIEDTAEGFCKKFEDNIRILSRRIRVAEQLHMENKDIHIKTKEKYEKEHENYKDIEGAIKMMRDVSFNASVILDKSDTAAIKFNEQGENIMNRISKASCEVLFAKDWIRRKNNSIKGLKEDADGLLVEMGKKEEEILGLRERVWKAENKVRELEKIVKGKDDEMLSVGEEKREAIRQLCVWIEYHRSRSDSLKKILSDVTAARRQRIA